MIDVTTPPCRSCSAQVFDACPACVRAALGAVSRAGICALGRAAPEIAGLAVAPLEMSYRLRIRIRDSAGNQLAVDELEVSQTVEMVDGAGGPDDVSGENAPDPAEPTRNSMRLEDFQTVFDRLELARAGKASVDGVITGELLGFDRLIGRFEILVAPGR